MWEPQGLYNFESVSVITLNVAVWGEVHFLIVKQLGCPSIFPATNEPISVVKGMVMITKRQVNTHV